MWLMTTEATLQTGLRVTSLQANTTKYSSNSATQVNKSKHTIINYLGKHAHKQHIGMFMNSPWIVFVFIIRAKSIPLNKAGVLATFKTL